MTAPKRIWVNQHDALAYFTDTRWGRDTEYIRADLVPQWAPVHQVPGGFPRPHFAIRGPQGVRYFLECDTDGQPLPQPPKDAK